MCGRLDTAYASTYLLAEARCSVLPLSVPSLLHEPRIGSNISRCHCIAQPVKMFVCLIDTMKIQHKAHGAKVLIWLLT